jgi:hypothetical protein
MTEEEEERGQEMEAVPGNTGKQEEGKVLSLGSNSMTLHFRFFDCVRRRLHLRFCVRVGVYHSMYVFTIRCTICSQRCPASECSMFIAEMCR